jgi:plasmid maintenance system killer protein
LDFAIERNRRKPHGRQRVKGTQAPRRQQGFWAVAVRANWRVIFRFADHDAFDVDYVDYH